MWRQTRWGVSEMWPPVTRGGSKIIMKFVWRNLWMAPYGNMVWSCMTECFDDTAKFFRLTQHIVVYLVALRNLGFPGFSSAVRPGDLWTALDIISLSHLSHRQDWRETRVKWHPKQELVAPQHYHKVILVTV